MLLISYLKTSVKTLASWPLLHISDDLGKWWLYSKWPCVSHHWEVSVEFPAVSVGEQKEWLTDPLKRLPGHFSLHWNETSTWSIQVIDYILAWVFVWQFMEEPRLGVNWTCEMHYIPLCIPYLPPQVKSKVKERWSLRSFRILSMIYFSFLSLLGVLV